MKTKIGISLVLTLLMIASAFSAVDATGLNCTAVPQEHDIGVSKTVWNGTSWVDYYESELNEIVTFNITVTYTKNCPNGYMAENIVVYDTLPAGLVYISSTPYAESWIDGNVIYWNLSEDYETTLAHGDSVYIEFTAEVTEYGEHINYVECEAHETCCGYDLYGDDCATVECIAPPPLEFEKLVFDPETQEWVDYLDGVLIGQIVRFKLIITYLGYEDVDVMKCMVVEDCLPECCLEYADNEMFTYPSELFDDPDIIVEGNCVVYDWTNKMFNLYVGETIEIEFDSEVVNYCYQEVENCAHVDLWGCLNCEEHISDEDCATVNCVPPEGGFEKFVQCPETGDWVKEAYQDVGETVRYRIKLLYYGNYNLTDVRIVDELPYVTEYANEATHEPSNVSEDGRKIWWNLTDVAVEDGEALIIEFDAYIWGSTGDCPGCGTNKAWFTAIESMTENEYDGYDEAFINTDVPCPDEVDFSLSIPKMKSIGSVCAYIENTGDVDLENVDWEINLSYGMIFKRNKKVNGTVDEILENLGETVCTGNKFGPSSLKCGFGKMQGTVTASVGGLEKSIGFSGFMLGRIILITQQWDVEEE